MKHINKRKPYDSDDEWSQIESRVGEKIDPGEVMEIQDRSITFNDNKFVPTKEEDYKEESDHFKDRFGNTAQYLKFINAHLAEKKNHLDKILADKDRFNDEIASLNPNLESKEHLDKINYNNVKAEDVKKVLKYVEDERDSIKERIEHFSSQINQANDELTKKNKQIDEINTELSFVKSEEQSKQETIEKEDDAVGVIQKELKSMASKNESEKIFGAINSLVVLLNSKNQATLKELKSVKSEFNKMKQEYDKVMHNLEQKKSKK